MKSVSKSWLLLLDSAINLILGLLLLIFPSRLVEWLGIPSTNQRFYPSLLGAVLFGIGIAILLEHFRSNSTMIGLGLGGAAAINVSGAFVLVLWLVFGSLDLAVHGCMSL